MRRVLLATALAALCGGCVSVKTSYSYPSDLCSADYVKRTLAVREFARKKDASRLPDAFALLMDPEGQIRALAYVTIRDLTPGHRDFGYRPYLGEAVRFGIVQRWRAYYEAQTDSVGEKAREKEGPHGGP